MILRLTNTDVSPGASSSIETAFHANPSFHNYTSGRRLWSEKFQLESLYTPFNERQLREIAAQGAGASSCEHMEKLPESHSNKYFLMTMAGGTQVVASIPNPRRIPSRIVTESEVATLDSLPHGSRDELGETLVGNALRPSLWLLSLGLTHLFLWSYDVSILSIQLHSSISH
jgi:hypothetical protein